MGIGTLVTIIAAIGRLVIRMLSAIGWGMVTLWQFCTRRSHGLHTAHFASGKDTHTLTTHAIPDNGFLVGVTSQKKILAVTPTPKRRELGNTLVVGPTRSGKGLLAVSQLLRWKHSAIINDIKGDLFTATAGYRATLGKVIVIDPSGIGHAYDPLATRQSEDSLYSAAASLLLTPDEGEGLIFTQRAIVMLTQLFQAARKEQQPPLPYVRAMIRSGIAPAAAQLQAIDPQLATQFLDGPLEQTDFSNRFLLSAWGTLTARLWPLLTDTLVRCFARSEFTADELLRSEEPVTVYFRWPERDLLALSPLVRLLWNSIIGELISSYDAQAGQGCQPILLLIDEAGRSAIPALADHATTVVGRGLNLWIAVQSLSQLETVYGKGRAQTLRDNCESMIFYRPTDLTTASYLEQRLGTHSAYAHSVTIRDGEETAEGKSERAIPLLTAQEIMQLDDGEILAFHRRLPPMRLARMDWREHTTLKTLHGMPAPTLAELPPVPTSLTQQVPTQSTSTGYIDSDQWN
jgi:type IV secretion system protein VirD4